jgi:DNA invertase Pin-like site-specific DNA recombinase
VSRHPKIHPQHLEQLAYVYIRQSTLRQVEQNLESRDLQYQLVRRAQALGWIEARIVTIDDDLGKSAVVASNRPGFQTLVTAVGLAQVGIILVTDVSRLARNCSDWYKLLDLAAFCDTLIGDAGAVYDPRDYNDRLLLGLKGTLAEAQWYSMRRRLREAQLNKARRGELAIRLPIGYDRMEDAQVTLTPDQEVQATIALVFEQFDGLGSARAVLFYFRRQRLQLPRRIQSGPARGETEWVKPSYHAIYRILKHPAYAGAYTYGKRGSVRLPGSDQKRVCRRLPMEEWAVLIQDAFPGYISWEQYLKNQERLRENAQGANWAKGAPRSGIALLQGLVICGRCGRPMHMRYSNQPAYVCEQANKLYGDPLCQNFMVPHIDEAVTAIFLEAIQPMHLEAALAAVEQVEAQRQNMAERWQQRLERARYEAELARRRYEKVDPDNRLVAGELERRWEEKLQAMQQLEREWRQAEQQELAPLSEADKVLIRHLAEDLPAIWHAETTTLAERKRLLRCLIQDVTLDSFTRPGFSIIRICWHTGTTTMVEVERPKAGCRTARAVVERIRELAEHHPDDQVADILNADGVPTATGKVWNRRRVANVRKNYGIATACPYFSGTSGPRGDGLICVREAGERLGISLSMVRLWFRRGALVGHQRRQQTPIWVRVTEDDLWRLDGSTQPRPGLVPVNEAAQMLGMTVDQVWEQVRSGKLLPYRLRVKKRWVWYVEISTKQTDPATTP